MYGIGLLLKSDDALFKSYPFVPVGICFTKTKEEGLIGGSGVYVKESPTNLRFLGKYDSHKL